jgi:hypothetical protein
MRFQLFTDENERSRRAPKIANPQGNSKEGACPLTTEFDILGCRAMIATAHPDKHDNDRPFRFLARHQISAQFEISRALTLCG